MSALKKFWIVFLSFLPLTAGAAIPLLLGAGVTLTGIVGFSIYRSMAPVNIADALKFFSSCWTCGLFSEVMSTMSTLLPRVYNGIAHAVIPVAAMLMGVWLAWKVFSDFINAKVPNAWSLSGDFGMQLIKFGVVCGLLLIPLPRLVTDVVIEPVFTVGLAVNNVASGVVTDSKFNECVIAVTLTDTSAASAASARDGAFSPWLRNSLACQVANVHQVTGLGMTIGWTMWNMAFDAEYMHTVLWNVPIFPNVPLFVTGLGIMILFLFALLPIPVYFLEIFIGLTMDLIMLPLMLLGWLFNGWAVLPNGGRSIRTMIDDVIKGTVGIALTGVFLMFSVMFLNAMFGKWGGVSVLKQAIDSNDSKLLMDGLMMRNDSLITIMLMGIFIAMFMIMIPALIKTLFDVKMSTKFYDSTKSHLKILYGGAKKWLANMKK